MVRRRDYLSAMATASLFGNSVGLLPHEAAGESSRFLLPSHDDYPFRRDDARVQLIDADPDSGFNYPYWLATPEEFRTGPIPLMMEMNDALKGQDVEDLEGPVWDQITRFELQGPWLSEELGVPHLIPVIPRPDGDPVDQNHETILLDRDAMLLESTDLARLDLQLLRMAEHAKQHALADHNMDEKVIFYGNSSGGVVGERMAAMHPEAILAVAGGAMNGLLVLPLAELGDHTLNYPVGVADFESILGKPYDRTAHDAVDKFYFLGDEDPANRLPMEGGYGNDIWNDKEVYDAARAVYGADPTNDRFPRCQLAFQKAGVRAQFRVYEGMTHNPEPASHDILEFFETSITGGDVSEFGQQLALQLDREPEIIEQTERADGLEIAFTVSGDYPPPAGLVAYRWDFGDSTSAEGLPVTKTFGEPGTYDVSLSMETANGQDAAGTIQVTYEAPSFEIDIHDLSAETVVVDESITLEATVRNDGNQAGTLSLEFTIDGDVVDETSVELDATETERVRFEPSFEAPGSYELGVNDRSAGSVTVEAESQTPEEENAETPGFGAVATLAGIGTGAGYLVYTKKQNDE